MAWQRKTLSEHIAVVIGWVEAGIVGGSAILRGSMLAILARVIAGVIALFEGFLDSHSKNLFVRTMDEEHLRQRAADLGIIPQAATFAMGYGYVTGTIGSMIVEGELLQRSDGVQFAIDTDILIDTSPKLVPIAAVDAGKNGNTIGLVNLSFVSPVTGVNSTIGLDANGLSGGSDDEDVESLRARILTRQSNPPRGGSESDYIKWAREISGVTRAWCFADWNGEGSVGVGFVYDNRADIFPTPAEVAAMQVHLIQYAPVTQKTRTFAFSPTPKPLNITLSITPDTPALRAAVTDALDDFLKADSSPGSTTLLSKLNNIISMVDGEEDHNMQSPSGQNITRQKQEFGVLGTITFNSN